MYRFQRRGLHKLLPLLLTLLSNVLAVGSLLVQDGESSDPRYYVQQAIEAHKKKDYQTYLRSMQQGNTLFYIADSQWGKVDRTGKLAAPELLRDCQRLEDQALTASLGSLHGI